MSDSESKTTAGQGEDPLLGTDLGGYRIRGILGRGGYAVVYRAEQTQLGREVALKVLNERAESGGTPDMVEAFRREARTAAALNHPCLVHVHDVGEAIGRHFLSMELVGGGDLARRIKRSGPIPWADALPIIRDLAEALRCAHEQGFLHRDVKPANVLLTPSGRAKLADLGLSDGKTHAGTPAFVSPEQILRKPVDHRTDLYSLGCTAFTMLVGRPPFVGKSSKQMLEDHVKKAPMMLRLHGVKVPHELEKLVDDLLAKNPDDRPRDAGEVLAILDQIESGSAPPARSQRVRRTRRAPRNEWTSIVLGVLFLLVVGIAAAYAWKYMK